MVGYILGMAAEEFVAESQKPFYKMAYKTSRNKGKRIFNSIQLNLFTLSNIRKLFEKLYKIDRISTLLSETNFCKN